jgi:hypothetical protein
MSTMVMKPKTKNDEKAPFLARQTSKWFYDTSTGTASKAACCGSFVREGFGHSVVS